MENDTEKKGPIFSGRVWPETKSKVIMSGNIVKTDTKAVSYTHLRAHET